MQSERWRSVATAKDERCKGADQSSSFVKGWSLALSPFQCRHKGGSVFLLVPSVARLSHLSEMRDDFVCFPKGEANESSPRSCFDFLHHGMDAWWLKSFQALSARSRRFVLAVYVVGIMAGKFVSKLTFSQDDITSAEKMEPAFESLLRSLKVNDAVIDAMRLNEITAARS